MDQLVAQFMITWHVPKQEVVSTLTVCPIRRELLIT